MNLSILYRGPLAGCNYHCGYCPFAKRVDSRDQLARDRQALSRFVDWLESQPQHLWKVLFTPWGEALVRPWYRRAVARLTHLNHLASVAVQTNLSCGLAWLQTCRADRLAFWATYHPTEVSADAFVRKVRLVIEAGARISVGMVGVPDVLDAVVAMRRLLPPEVYLWINAQQPRPLPYTSEEVALLTSIDPQFTLTLRRLRSLGQPCRTGEQTFTVDGRGDMRRCHFVDEVIGNIHSPDWPSALRPRPCPNAFCDCFLGKAQLKSDALTPFFGANLLERIPVISTGGPSGHVA
ncbi:STM4011 family radical SAM protein [Singulisphaera sp. PoT]|uniref:STM4011 family radical SAM protein n=1 Tax=Singulisphaera sp. PoT TaxID=3411797 RepID=UPI003BF56922